MSHPKILVLGSTGAIGKEVSLALIRRKVPFRAAVHTASKADFLNEHKDLVQVVELDLSNQESIDKAFHGIEKVFLMTPPGYTLATQPLIEAAKSRSNWDFDRFFTGHHLKHIVKLSALGAHEEDKTKFEWAYEHRLVEESIVKEGIPLTSLRPSSFFTNIFHDVHPIKTQSAFYKIIGDEKMNWISNHDIGEAAAIILTHEHHDQLRKNALHFVPAQGVEAFVNMNNYFKNGGYNAKSEDLEKIIGNKGKHLKDFIHDNIAAFQ